jgi:hypothetical protein
MTLAVCAMVRNEAANLPEWLAFHALAGATLFRIYDNESNDGTAGVLDRLTPFYGIERITWPGRGIRRQLDAYDDAISALVGRASWVAFIDLDEFLFDPMRRSLPAILAALPDDIGAVQVNQCVFGSAGQELWEDDLVIARFTRRTPDDDPEHRWVKTILRPEAAAGFSTTHSAVLRAGRAVLGDFAPFAAGDPHPGEVDRIATHGLRLHHYMLKSLAEFRRKQLRGANSDRPEEGYARLSDDYFFAREPRASEVVDCTLADIAERVRHRMRAAELACAVTI